MHTLKKVRHPVHVRRFEILRPHSRIAILFAAGTAASPCLAASRSYEASLNTLPESQGWTFTGPGGSNPAPAVSGGILSQNRTDVTAGEGWLRSDLINDFSATAPKFVLQTSIKVNSSGYADGFSSIGGGFHAWRSGYQVYASDSVGRHFIFGLASSGLRLSTDQDNLDDLRSGPFISLDTTTAFNTYRLEVANGVGSLFVNDVLKTSLTLGTNYPPINRIVFGSNSNTSSSEPLSPAVLANTQMKYLRYGVGAPAWAVNANGNWDAADNWFGAVPNAVDATANFGAVITAARAVTLVSPQSAGTVSFDNVNSYTLAGPGTLTLQASSVSAISVLNGSHTIAAPVNFASNTSITVTNATDTLSITSPLLAPGRSIGKAGAGTLQTQLVYAALLDVAAGVVKIIAQPENNTLAGTSVIESITVAAGAKLDLANNSTIVNYTGASPIAALRDSIKIGFNSASWTGTGITSSSAAIAAGTSLKTALGYAEASTLGLGSGSFFGGIALTDDSAVLVKYTLSGDANLDGVVNGLDFNAIAGHFGVVTGKVWTQGDFNYDGLTNTLDFNGLAGNFNQTLPAGSPPAPGTLVPEPASILWLGLPLFLRRGFSRARRLSFENP